MQYMYGKVIYRNKAVYITLNAKISVFQWDYDVPDRYISYSRTSDISTTLEGNIIVDHSDVVGASPVGAAPTTPSFSI